MNFSQITKKVRILGNFPDLSTLRSERKYSKSPSEKSDDSSGASTIHIEEDFVNSRKSSNLKIPVINQIDDDAASCTSSHTEKSETLHDELMKLCYEIESVNGLYGSDNGDGSSVDLTFQEEKHLRNIMEKVKTHLTMTKIL